ncbi:hypothetical protein M7I_0714 [Glarea lozoyensis 74030]|nr:hypothetical protein M7I_0714 [Glarea lozoyensis 74030]
MIRFIETEIIEIQDTCNSVNEQLQTGDFDDRAERLEVLDVGRIMIGDRRAQHSELTQKLIHATQERSLPGTLFWLNLEETLVRYNLIDETHIEESLQAFVDHDENPAPSPNQEDPELYQENQEFSDQSELQADQVMEEETRRLSASTDLEMAVDEVPDVGARQNAWERLHLAQGGYDEAREKFDDWPQYYHHQYVGYQAGYDRGAISTTKTEFDNILFIRERQAGLELIEAEKQLQEARKDIKSLGLDPESGFVESFYDEDEAALEFDPDCVDRSKIEKWLSGNPPHDSIDDEMWLPHPEKQGDWADDACSLAFGESVSVVAEGPERVEIDEWKVECARVYRESQRIYRESLTA